MSARQKNKHKSRHRTHTSKPANLPRVSLAKSRVVAETEPVAAAASAKTEAAKA